MLCLCNYLLIIKCCWCFISAYILGFNESDRVVVIPKTKFYSLIVVCFFIEE